MKPIDLFDASVFLAAQPFDEVTALGHCSEIRRFLASGAGKFLRDSVGFSLGALMERIVEHDDVSPSGLAQSAKMRAAAQIYSGLIQDLPPEILDVEQLCQERIKRAEDDQAT